MPQSPEELLDGLDLTPPAMSQDPEPALEAAAFASPGQARSTLVAEADEAEDLRRRITRPISTPDYEVNLEEVSPPEAMEEITLDSEELPTFEPEEEPDSAEPTMAPLSLEVTEETEIEEPLEPEPLRAAPPVVSRAARTTSQPPLS